MNVICHNESRKEKILKTGQASLEYHYAHLYRTNRFCGFILQKSVDGAINLYIFCSRIRLSGVIFNNNQSSHSKILQNIQKYGSILVPF